MLQSEILVKKARVPISLDHSKYLPQEGAFVHMRKKPTLNLNRKAESLDKVCVTRPTF